MSKKSRLMLYNNLLWSMNNWSRLLGHTVLPGKYYKGKNQNEDGKRAREKKKDCEIQKDNTHFRGNSVLSKKSRSISYSKLLFILCIKTSRTYSTYDMQFMPRLYKFVQKVFSVIIQRIFWSCSVKMGKTSWIFSTL